jgi:DNA-directed RNA polymerase specialized sigma subunit
MPKQKKQDAFDASFYKLASEVTHCIDVNKDGTDQKQQVEELMDAESKFKDTILKYRQSTEVYKKFLQKVCVINKNILSARPYFRESAITFSKKITPAIKIGDIDTLKTFNINYQLIKFIKDAWLGPFPKRAEQLFNRVHKAREVLIENNMPLAINRAKLFYRKTPKSHLSLMDMIGICGAGLMAGVDKYCGKYTPVFRSVIIGRCVGNLIDAYSETMLHFYPRDRRILYKAHTIRGRKGIDEIKELTEAVNTSFKEDEKEGKTIPKHDIETGELSYLMNAASTVSSDQTISIDGEGTFGVYDYTADATQDLEAAYAAKEITSQMLVLASKLPLLQRKVLRLKGIKL